MNVAPKSNNPRFDYNNNKFDLKLKRYQIGFDHCFSQHGILFYAQYLLILNSLLLFDANFPKFENIRDIRILFPRRMFFILDTQIIYVYLMYSNLIGATQWADDIFWFLIIFQKVQFICRMLDVECERIFGFLSSYFRIEWIIFYNFHNY